MHTSDLMDLLCGYVYLLTIQYGTGYLNLLDAMLLRVGWSEEVN